MVSHFVLPKGDGKSYAAITMKILNTWSRSAMRKNSLNQRTKYMWIIKKAGLMKQILSGESLIQRGMLMLVAVNKN